MMLVPLWVVFLYWVPANLNHPLGRDQGIFAWTGTVLLRGGLPYSSAWEVKGPLTHALYALAIFLFGRSEPSIRMFDLLTWFAAGLIYLRLGWLITKSSLPGLLALPLLLCVNGGGYWNTAQPDQWAGVLLAASMMVVLSPSPAARKYVLAGAVLSLAALIKPFYALFALVLLLGAVQEPSRRFWRYAASLLAGFVAPVLLTLAIYAAAHQLPTLWDVYVRFNVAAHVKQNQFPWQTQVNVAANILGWGYYSAAGLLQIAALAGVVATAYRNRKAGLMLAASLPLCLLMVVLQKKAYAYQFLPYAVFIALAAALAIDHVASYPVTSWRVALMWLPLILAAAFVVTWVLLSPYTEARIYWSHAGARNAYERGFKTSDFSHHDIQATAAYLRANTGPNDTVYLWGFDALIYFLANRQAPTRFGFNYPLLIDEPDHRRQERMELLQDLRRAPPAFIVVERKDANNLMPLSSDQYLLGFPELRELIAGNYQPRYSTPRFQVYGLEAASPLMRASR